MRKNEIKHLWVIEQKNPLDGGWSSTTGAGITKNDAIYDMNFYWKRFHPMEKFRVTKYIRAAN